MSIGGGTFTAYNKILPGTYFRNFSRPRPIMQVRGKGTVIMPLDLSWGSEDDFIEVFAMDLLDGRSRSKIGLTAYDDFKLTKTLETTLGNCRKVLAMRKNRGGSPAMAGIEDLVATAAQTGTAGDNLAFAITAIEGTNLFNVSVLWKGQTVEPIQEVQTLGEIESGDFIKWSWSADDDTPLTDYVTAGVDLNGGTDGTFNSATFYPDFFQKAKFQNWDVMRLNTFDPAVIRNGIQYIRRLSDEEGIYGQIVVPNDRNIGEVNDELVITVEDKVWLVGEERQDASIENLVGIVAGMRASNPLNSNIANTPLYQVAGVLNPKDKHEHENAIRRGVMTVWYDIHDGIHSFVRDINTFRIFTPLKNEEYHYNQTIDLLRDMKRNIARAWKRYENTVLNNDIGRILWHSEVDTLLASYAAQGLLAEYEGVDDIVVLGRDEMENPNWINSVSGKLRSAILSAQIDITGLGLTKADVVTIFVINNVVQMERLYATAITE